MTALFDWVKLVLENKWLVMLVIGMFSSVATNVGQVFTVQEKEQTIKATQQQVATVAEAYTKEFYKVDNKPDKVDKDCCQTLMRNHIREYH